MATLSHPVSHPLALPPNQPPRFYRGGAAIASLRGLPQSEEWGPEDWVGSTTTLFGQAESGLSHLPDGRRLRDAIAADPEGFLGAEHAEHFGSDPAVLSNSSMPPNGCPSIAILAGISHDPTSTALTGRPKRG